MTLRLFRYLFGILPISFALIGCEKKPPDGTTPTASKIPAGNNLLYAHGFGYYGGSVDRYGIYTSSDTGSTETPLIESQTILFGYPNWGKGDKIYFLSCPLGGAGTQVYSIDFNGTNIQRLSKDTLAAYAALDFSPVNERFLYRKTKGGVKQLCSNNIGMNDEKVLLSRHASASWNPNGLNIVYSDSEPDSSGTNVMNIYLMNADGTGRTKITSNTGPSPTYFSPYISPDGKKIVYTSNRRREVTNHLFIINGTDTLWSYLTDVYTCNIDGSHEQRITNSVPQSDFWYNANWAKDSKTVLVIHHGIRIMYDLRLRNTDDRSDRKSVSSSWLMIEAEMR